jgi:ribosomal protein S18 acetylase RimI-like enzyme
MSVASPFQIRAARSADALCLAALSTQVFLDTYATDGINPDHANEVKDHHAEEVFGVRLKEPEVEITVAELNGNLVGFIDVQYGSTCPASSVIGPEVLRLYIQQPFQNKGLGHALLEHAEESARVQEAEAIWLTTWVANTRAVAFYPRVGYKRVGATQYIISGKAYENHVFAKQLTVSGA